MEGTMKVKVKKNGYTVKVSDSVEEVIEGIIEELEGLDELMHELMHEGRENIGIEGLVEWWKKDEGNGAVEGEK